MCRAATASCRLAALFVVACSLTATAGAAAPPLAEPAAPAAGTTQPAPDPAALLARAKEASGGRAWDAIVSSHQRGTLRTGGLDGAGESIADVRSGHYVERYTIGPTSGADGFDGTTTWSQDSSGQPRVEDSADSRLGAVDEAYRNALAYWYPARWPATFESLGRRDDAGRAGLGVRITPRGGRPFELWIDAATGLVDHLVEVGGSETRSTYFSDYRAVDGGVKIAFRQRSTNGETRYDQFLEVESVVWNEPLAAHAFAMPAPPPPDFRLAGGATSTTVPFQLLNNHIYVDVELNGKGPFKVLCDTGGSNIVTPEMARTLGLAPQGALQGRGVGETSTDIGFVKLTSL